MFVALHRKTYCVVAFEYLPNARYICDGGKTPKRKEKRHHLVSTFHPTGFSLCVDSERQSNSLWIAFWMLGMSQVFFCAAIDLKFVTTNWPLYAFVCNFWKTHRDCPCFWCLFKLAFHGKFNKHQATGALAL